MSESTAAPRPAEDETDVAPASSAPPRPSVVLGSVALNTDEPKRLAEFYASLLGWEVLRVDEDWVNVGPPGQTPPPGKPPEAPLAFQLVTDYTPPTWPTQEVPQQFHLDLDVVDLDEGERFALSVGARRVPDAGVEGSFRVFLDPSGHPFCLCRAA